MKERILNFTEREGLKPLPDAYQVELNQSRRPNSVGESRFFLGNFSNPKQSKAMLGNWQLR
jgi:hypothetical protein